MNFFTTYNHLNKLQEEASSYYRFEVFDDEGEPQGGIYRGTNKLLKALYDADDEHYDYIDEALYWLEIKTPYPEELDDPKIKFAYKQDFYTKYIEVFKDFEAELNEVGWSMSTIKLNRPEKIVYEDYVQIAFIE